MQTTFLGIFSFGGVTPDLILIVVVYCGINFSKKSGIGLSVLVGFIQDCLSGSLLGVNTLSKGLVGVFFSALKDKIIVEGGLAISFFIFCTSLFDGMIYFIAMTSLMGAQFRGDFFFSQILLFAVYNIVTGLFLFYIFDRSKPWMHRRFPNQVFQPI
jgi:rod shape-determining protein MreD